MQCKLNDFQPSVLHSEAISYPYFLYTWRWRWVCFLSPNNKKDWIDMSNWAEIWHIYCPFPCRYNVDIKFLCRKESLFSISYQFSSQDKVEQFLNHNINLQFPCKIIARSIFRSYYVLEMGGKEWMNEWVWLGLWLGCFDTESVSSWLSLLWHGGVISSHVLSPFLQFCSWMTTCHTS